MIKKISLALFIFIFTFSCSSEDDNQSDFLSNSSEIFDSVVKDDITLGFDRSAMLVFWADNFIMPAYKKLKDNLSFTIDTKADYLRVKKFIKLNNCIPWTNNMSKYSQKKFLNQ